MTLPNDLRLDAELIRRRRHSRNEGEIVTKRPVHTEDHTEDREVDNTGDYVQVDESLTVLPDEVIGKVIAIDPAPLAGSPTERDRIVESQMNLEQPIGVSVAGVISPAVNKTTIAIIKECDEVIASLQSLRSQMSAHDELVVQVLEERDAHVRQVLIEHGQFAKEARKEFDRIKQAISAIADSHVVEDGKPVPTSSDT